MSDGSQRSYDAKEMKEPISKLLNQILGLTESDSSQTERDLMFENFEEKMSMQSKVKAVTKTLTDTEKTLKEKESSLLAAQGQLNKKQEELTGLAQQLSEQGGKFDIQKIKLEEKEKALKNTKESLKITEEELTKKQEELTGTDKQLSQKQTELDKEKQKLDDVIKRMSTLNEKLEIGLSKIEEISKKSKLLNNSVSSFNEDEKKTFKMKISTKQESMKAKFISSFSGIRDYIPLTHTYDFFI